MDRRRHFRVGTWVTTIWTTSMDSMPAAGSVSASRAFRRHARGFFSLVQIMGQPQGGGQLRQQIGVYGRVLWGGCGMSFSAHV